MFLSILRWFEPYSYIHLKMRRKTVNSDVIVRAKNKGYCDICLSCTELRSDCAQSVVLFIDPSTLLIDMSVIQRIIRKQHILVNVLLPYNALNNTHTAHYTEAAQFTHNYGSASQRSSPLCRDRKFPRYT